MRIEGRDAVRSRILGLDVLLVLVSVLRIWEILEAPEELMGYVPMDW